MIGAVEGAGIVLNIPGFIDVLVKWVKQCKSNRKISSQEEQEALDKIKSIEKDLEKLCTIHERLNEWKELHREIQNVQGVMPHLVSGIPQVRQRNLERINETWNWVETTQVEQFKTGFGMLEYIKASADSEFSKKYRCFCITAQHIRRGLDETDCQLIEEKINCLRKDCNSLGVVIDKRLRQEITEINKLYILLKQALPKI